MSKNVPIAMFDDLLELEFYTSFFEAQHVAFEIVDRLELADFDPLTMKRYCIEADDSEAEFAVYVRKLAEEAWRAVENG